MENIYHRPVIPLLIAFMAGLILGDQWPGRMMAILPILMGSAGLVIFQIVRNKTPSFSPLSLFFALGYFSLQFWTNPSFPSNHVIHFTDGNAHEISGVVVGEPEVKNHRIQLVLAVKTLSQNEESFLSTGNIRVTLIGEKPVPENGDILTLTSPIRSIRNFANPGGFDYERFMAFERIWGSAYAMADKVKIKKAEGKNRFARSIDAFRNRIRILTENSGSQSEVNILRALIIGDKTGISDDDRENFNRTGLGHILAISGLHVGIVASIFFLMFRKILSFIPFLLRRAWVGKSAAILTFFPVLFYGLISGMSPSTQRAVIMTTVFLTAFQVEREQNLLNTLAISALVILAAFPPAMFSVSFQLSFAAVGAILLGIAVLPESLKISRGSRVLKWRNRFLNFLWISLFATLGTLPLTLYYFNLTSTIALAANCFAIPIIGFLAVPLGIVSAFISPVSESIAVLGFKACAFILEMSLEIIRYMAGFDYAAVRTITPSILEIVCFYLLLWSICGYRKHPAAKWAIAAVAVVMVVDAGYWAHRRLLHKDFRVTVLDVGQGTASLLEFPKGYTMLIDGGGFSDRTTFDVGERIVAPYLWRNKIRTVDTLVLSHPDSDHLNGLIYIAENFHVKNIWTNQEPADTAAYKQLLDVMLKKDINHPLFRSLPRTMTINGVEVKILNPPQDFNPESTLAKIRGDNNNSLVVKAVFGDISILFPGDIAQAAEMEILSRNRGDLASVALVCPHHGSRYSSTPEYIRAVNPKYVIITTGWRNRFGFPHPDVLKRYREQGCRILRTDLNGAVRMISDGKVLKVKPTVTLNPAAL
jgi:competence protein ComEC